MASYLSYDRWCDWIDGENEKAERCLSVSKMMLAINLVGVVSHVYVKFNFRIEGRSNVGKMRGSK